MKENSEQSDTIIAPNVHPQQQRANQVAQSGRLPESIPGQISTIHVDGRPRQQPSNTRRAVPSTSSQNQHWQQRRNQVASSEQLPDYNQAQQIESVHNDSRQVPKTKAKGNNPLDLPPPQYGTLFPDN